MYTWKKLDHFWKKHTNTVTKKWKILVFDSIIRSKLLYGLETVQLTKTQLNKIDAFQTKGLRKILNLKTTFYDRANTNQTSFETANQIIHNTRVPQEGNNPINNKNIKQFSEMITHTKTKLVGHILRSNNEDPLRQCTYEIDTADPKHIGIRRRGGPRQNWTKHNHQHIWNNKLNQRSQYDPNDTEQNLRILAAALNREF